MGGRLEPGVRAWQGDAGGWDQARLLSGRLGGDKSWAHSAEPFPSRGPRASHRKPCHLVHPPEEATVLPRRQTVGKWLWGDPWSLIQGIGT